MKNKYVVYIHRRKDTGEVFYVGIGDKNRPYHTKQSRSDWWKSIVNKHGHTVEIIKKGLLWESACEEEIRLIKHYGRKDLGLGTLVNMTNGGDGAKGLIHSEENIEFFRKRMIENNPFKGKHHSKESLKIMRQKKIKQYLGEGNPFYGKFHSEETKRKISESKKGTQTGKNNPFYGKKHSNESIEKMSPLEKKDVIYIRKNFVKGVNQHNRGNLVELADKFGVTRECIQGIISNRTWKHI